MAVTRADIAAIADVVADLYNEIEAMTAGEALLMEEALHRVEKAMAACRSLVRTRALNAMDGQPITVDGIIYAPKQDGKWRPDHGKIDLRVYEAALVNDDGEAITSTEAAVSRAIRLMRDLFVSPAMVPKESGLKKLRLDLRDVSHWERGVPTIKKIDMKEADHE